MNFRTSSTIRTLASFAASAVLVFSAFGCGGGEAAEGAAPKTAEGGPAHPLLGKPAPEVTSEFVTGDGPKNISEGKGKVLILDFWGTFCHPCQKSFPKYQELVEQFGGAAAVLAVSIDEAEDTKKEQLITFAKEHKAKFAIAWDKDHAAAKSYGLAALTMPSSFVIDKEGIVRHVHVGFSDGEEIKIAEEIKALK